MRRDAGSVEVRGDFSDHFWVFDGNREVLLLDGFPVDAAELVDLVDEVADGVGVGCICGIDAFYAEFDGERETIVWVESGLFVAGVVAEEVTACTEVDVSSAVWHEVIAGSIEEDLVLLMETMYTGMSRFSLCRRSRRMSASSSRMTL